MQTRRKANNQVKKLEESMKTWEKNIRRVEPYVPGEQPNKEHMIKLNTNENPYPPALGVEKVLKEMDYHKFRLYPDPTAKALVKAIADRYQLEENQVFVGVGSDDVLAMAFLTFFNSDKPILFPDITYSFYDVWANMLRIPYQVQPLDENFQIQAADYTKENGGVIFPNPNAPTGVLVDLAFIEEILKQNQDVVVIVDEAYIDFGGQSALPLLKKYENLLIVQTFSKSRSLAGIRIGYAMGNAALIQAMQDVKYSFNSYTMNLPSIQLGVAAIEDHAYFEKTKEKIIATRERTKVRLKELGFSFQDSMTNFIFVTHKYYAAKDIFEYLKTKEIYVRYFSSIPRIRNYLRISIGTDSEMDTLIAVLMEYLK